MRAALSFIVRVLGGDEGAAPVFLGTGVVVAPDRVLTCRHVIVEPAPFGGMGDRAYRSLAVMTADGVVLPVRRADLHEASDLAVVELETPVVGVSVPPLLWGLTQALEEKLRSSALVAFGYAAADGAAGLRQHEVSRLVLLPSYRERAETLADVQLSGGLPVGCSGGPVLLRWGEGWLYAGTVYLGGEKAATSRVIMADPVAEFLDRLGVRDVARVDARRALAGPPVSARAMGDKNVQISGNEICEPIQASTTWSILKPSGFKNFQTSTNFIRPLKGLFSLNYLTILSIMVASCSTAAVIITLKEVSLINKIEDLTADIYMRIYNELSRDVKSTEAVGFAFINIDNESFTTWTSRAEGSVLQTPRDKLQALIHFAVQVDPALIVVDVDLSLQPGQHSEPSDADKMLTNFLRNWEGTDSRQSKCLEARNRVPIFLQREIVPQPGWSRGKAGKLQVSWHELERAVDDCPHLHWVSTLFKPSPDGVIRRSRSCWEARRNGHVQLVPSAHYLARTILNDHNGGAPLPRSAEDQAEGADLACLAGHSSLELCASLVSHRLAEIGCDGSEEDRRFLFPMRWSRQGPPTTPLVSATGQPLLRFVPASQIVECSRLDRPECKHVNEIMTGRIVVIGGTYDAARDWHPTPVGVMPGAIILINAMHTALNLPQTMEREPEHLRYVLMIVELLIIITLIISYNMRKLPGKFTKIVTSPLFISLILFIPINFFLSFYYLQFGMWIVPTLAIIGMLCSPMFGTLMGRIWTGARQP